MVMNLIGDLESSYKSFDANFHFELEGNLVVISGINGGGKSQLFEIIRQLKQPEPQPDIIVKIQINSKAVSRDDVAYRSFKENISIPTFKHTDPQIQQQSRSQIWNNYNTAILKPSHKQLVNHQKCSQLAKEILIKEFGEEKFNSRKITNQEIMECRSLDKFIWRSDDIFENVISELFYEFAIQKFHLEAFAGKSGTPVEYKSIGEAPWAELNALFEKFKFNYRFKDTYEIREGGFSLDETPRLYLKDNAGNIDMNQPRELTDLSDGEKAIFSLVFGSLSGVVEEKKKILLLDEFDATLNPSLTNIFYEILDEYFIKKGVMVIVATHSPTTISLAPEITSFYEVFNKLESEKRVLPVPRDSYSELQIANKNFIDAISNQIARIIELEKQNELLKSLEARLDHGGQIVVATEGKTDGQHLSYALRRFQENGEFTDIDVDFFVSPQNMGDSELNNCFDAYKKIPPLSPIVFIFDRDVQSTVRKFTISETGFLHANNVAGMCLEIPKHRSETPNICIEHLYQDIDLQTPLPDTQKRLRFFNEIGYTSDRKSSFLRPTPGPYDIRIFDTDVSQLGNEDGSDIGALAISKSVFLEKLVKSEIGSNFDVEGFRPTFEMLQRVITTLTSSQ